MPQIYHLIGFVPPNRGGGRSTHGMMIVYRPGGHEYSKGPLFGVGEACYRPEEQGVADAASWQKNGMDRFLSHCREGGCAWFIPLVQRLAEGGEVSFDEVSAAYAANNQGRPMPSGYFRELLKYVEEQGWLK